MKNKPYWKNICEMQERQKENKDLDMFQVLEYLQEELIDALMYIEHIKKLVEIMKEEVEN